MRTIDKLFVLSLVLMVLGVALMMWGTSNGRPDVHTGSGTCTIIATVGVLVNIFLNPNPIRR